MDGGPRREERSPYEVRVVPSSALVSEQSVPKKPLSHWQKPDMHTPREEHELEQNTASSTSPHVRPLKPKKHTQKPYVEHQPLLLQRSSQRPGAAGRKLASISRIMAAFSACLLWKSITGSLPEGGATEGTSVQANGHGERVCGAEATPSRRAQHAREMVAAACSGSRRSCVGGG